MQSFSSSFSNIDDFDLYTKPGDYNVWQELSKEKSFINDFSHKAYILKQNALTNVGKDAELVHRGYWIKTFRQPFKGLIHMQLVVDASMSLAYREDLNDWWSPLTVGFKPDWSELFTLGMGPEGFLTLQHVPVFGKKDFTYTQNKVKFPQNQWVKLDVVIDIRTKPGKIELYQDKLLTCAANINITSDEVCIVHGGLYCSAAVSKCITYNGYFLTKELARQEEATTLIEADFSNTLFPKATRYLSLGGVA